MIYEKEIHDGGYLRYLEKSLKEELDRAQKSFDERKLYFFEFSFNGLRNYPNPSLFKSEKIEHKKKVRKKLHCDLQKMRFEYA